MARTTVTDAPEPVWRAEAQLGEGPVWVDRDQAVYWVDIKGGHIHCLYWPSLQTRTWRTGCQIGCLHPTSSGDFVAALEDGIRLLTLDPASSSVISRWIADPERNLPENRFNDGKIGPDGAFWVGSMDDRERRATGSLYRMDALGTWMAVDKGYTVSNGPAFSPDGRTLYHTDTLARTIYAFDCDAYGAATGKRPFIVFGEADGYPDGMCVDADGCLWVGHWGGGRLTRFSDRGETMSTVPIPAANVTSCCFGGDDLRTLFITTARKGLDAEDISRQPLAGSLFALRAEAPGFPTRYFDWSGLASI